MNQEFEIISHSQMNFKLFSCKYAFTAPPISIRILSSAFFWTAVSFFRPKMKPTAWKPGISFVVNPFQSHELKADSPALLVSLQVHPSFFSSYYPRIANLEFTSLILQRDGTDVRKNCMT